MDSHNRIFLEEIVFRVNQFFSENIYTVEALLRGHPDKRPPTLEKPLDYVNPNKNELISTPNGRPPLLKATFLVQKGWLHCNYIHDIMFFLNGWRMVKLK